MSSASENNGRSTNPRANEGVLANLPRTRPQRASPRRAAARKAASATATAASAKPKARAAVKSAGAAKANAAKSRGAAATKTPTRRTPPKAAPKVAPRRRAADIDASVPRQGFESEMDRATGPVQPPGGAELVSSAAEIFGELARTGISRGERLLKDALARLPL